ncbi:MBL fold metallo-hydrolase [Bradyrhizobium sp. STM 3562]|uniref:MBL fold metallo-hydrolase n=1 Tax=Bradyrhizobium sp. STM 3562 TaxID=578924 RepID=UPI00388E1D19
MNKTITTPVPCDAGATNASSDAGLSRRTLLAALAAAPVAAAAMQPVLAAEAGPTDAALAAQTALKNASGTKLVILGTTGGPAPMLPGRTRHMTSHVMLSNGAAYVLDCGLGVTNQYARTGIPFSALKSIFLTHHHPDHNVEYGPLLIVGWVQGMPLTVRAFGPPPLKQMTEDFLRAYRQTVEFWSEDFHLAPLTSIEVQEISGVGPVMQDDNVKVSATIVNHPPVTPALGYRFDFKDRSIAFSGDTTAVEAMVQIAKGADVLVHEALYLPALDAYLRDRIAKGFPVKYDAFMAHMKADHAPVEDVGRIAEEAGVKTLVLSHLTPGLDSIKEEDWRDGAARNFKGEIIVARDLMVI